MTTTDQPATDLEQLRNLVERAITAAVPAGQMVQRRARPESTYSWPAPSPLGGLQAALTVARMAQTRAHKYAIELRGEGTSWATIADLLEIAWSEEYVRTERAYELVAGPAGSYGDLRVYWRCGGPRGCGEYVTDRGPYEGNPANCEDGHAEECRRLEAETAAYEREWAERERRARVMEEAMEKVADRFGQETVKRARYVQSHGGRYLGWSTSETLGVALALRDTDTLKQLGYSTQKAALERILSGAEHRPADTARWLRLVRLAATGTT